MPNVRLQVPTDGPSEDQAQCEALAAASVDDEPRCNNRGISAVLAAGRELAQPAHRRQRPRQQTRLQDEEKQAPLPR